MSNIIYINQSYNFQVPIVKDKIYKCCFFDHFEVNLVYTSADSQNFEKIIKDSVMSPITSIRICSEGNATYFCYCCQNCCCLIQYTKNEQILPLLNKICKKFMIYLSPQDYEYIKSLDKSAKKLPDSQFNEILQEYTNVDRIFFSPLNLQISGNDMTFAKFLLISHSLISSFYIRRNYFPYNQFDNSFPVDCPVRSYNQYSDNDFYFLRQIQTQFVNLYFERRTGYLCVRKFYQDRTIYEKEVNRIHYIKYHPNILNCFGFIDDSPDKCPSLLFEFASNSSLDNFFESGKVIDDTTKTLIVYQILGGLDYLHMIGIIHQDLVPENILITQNYNVCISHFYNSRIYLGEDKFDPPQGFSFYDDLALFGVLIYEIANMKLLWDRKQYQNITATSRLHFVLQGSMQYLPIEFGSIVALYEKCVRNYLSNRLSTFIYLNQFCNYYYYFYDAELSHLFKDEYQDQIQQTKIVKVKNGSQVIQHEEMKKEEIRKDIQYVEYQASKSEPDNQSLYRLGLFYRQDSCLKKDIGTSHYYIARAANSSLDEAFIELISEFFDGERYLKLDTCLSALSDFSQKDGYYKSKFLYSKYILEHPMNFEEGTRGNALNLLIEATRVNADAMYYLGDNMLEGRLFPKDDKNAVAYIQEATKQACDAAVYKMAVIYENGIPNVVEKDNAKALKYYFLAASLLNVYALNVLVQKYKSFEQIKDKIYAFRLLKKAAKRKILTGLKFIGIMYRDWARNQDNQDPQDKKSQMMAKAMNYLNLAADQGDMDSIFEIANYFYEKENLSSAFKYYQEYKKKGGGNIINGLESLS